MHRGVGRNRSEDGNRLPIIARVVKLVVEVLVCFVIMKLLVVFLILRAVKLRLLFGGQSVGLASEKLQAFQHVQKVDDTGRQVQTVLVENSNRLNVKLQAAAAAGVWQLRIPPRLVASATISVHVAVPVAQRNVAYFAPHRQNAQQDSAQGHMINHVKPMIY